MRILLMGVLMLFGHAALAAGVITLDGRSLTPTQIDATVTQLMQANDVKGLGLALIERGSVRYLHGYGLRDVERALPLLPDTVMYGASLTKATFAWMVMQLYDEGRVDLDRPIAAYLPKPLPQYEQYAELADDPRWQRLTLRMLLDHTSGFQNFRFFPNDGGYDAGGKLAIHFDPGTRFAYSGEGILLAQRVLEWGLGLDVGAEMQRRVFDRFGMHRSSMTWRDAFAGNLARGYTLDGQMQEHEQRKRVRAPGSMDTTLTDFARFIAAVVRGEGLGKATFAEMTRSQIAIDSATMFPTLSAPQTGENRAIKLGYGLGWGAFDTRYGHAFFKEGHDDGTANYALCIAPRQACIVLLSNSARAEGIFKALVDTLLGPTGFPWRWHNYQPWDLPAALDDTPH